MSSVEKVFHVVARQAPSAVAATATSAVASVVQSCSSRNGFDGRLGLRVSAIFVILVGSWVGKQF